MSQAHYYPSSFFINAAKAQRQHYTSQSQETQDLQKYLDKKLGANSIVDADIYIYYKGNNTIVIRGEALEPILHQISNEKFWKAIEILEHDFGYKLDKLVVMV